MAENLIDLRRRIKAVKNTQKTFRAMKTVSAAKLRRSVLELNRATPVLEKIESLLKRVAPGVNANVETHPFLKERDAGKTVIVAVSADKGLCGAFNSHLIERARDHFQQQAAENGENPSLVTVGNKAFNYFNKRDYPIEKNYKSIMSRLKYHHVLDLSTYLQDIYLDPVTNIKKIEFIFTKYVSASRQEITIQQLFPIEREWGEAEEEVNEKDIEFIFEPSREEIFKYLLPKYINSCVHIMLLQSAASEHVARMTAMELATQNADEMIRMLTLTMNKLRQASITKELLEIITATEALKK
jgi:F-type H+-transporting ATPase subunit gamma